MRSFEMTEIGKRGLTACLDEAFEIALDECDAVFLSVDIDVCDPGHAPGTGTPEPGGLSSARPARRRTPDLPRAAGRRHRRGRGLAALRPRRDHRVPGQPGLPRGALRAGGEEGRHHPRPGGTAARGPMSDARSSAAAALRRAPVPRRRPTSWSRAAASVAVGPAASRGRRGRGRRRACWPGLHRRARAPDPGRARAAALRPVRARARARSTSPRSARTPTPPRRRVDPRRWLGDAGVPGRHAAGRRPRRRGAGPAGVPAQPRPPRRLGQQPRAGARRHHRDTPDPPDGRIERDADGHPSGTLHEGATALVSAAPAPHHRRRLPRGAAGRPGLPALARRHQLAGRDRRLLLRHGRPRRRPTSTRRRAASSARTSSARCGGTGARASSRSPTWSGGARR